MGRGPVETQRQETNEAMKSQDEEIGRQETHTDGTTLIVLRTVAVPMEEAEGWKSEHALL